MHVTCPAHLIRLHFVILICNNKPVSVNLMLVNLTTDDVSVDITEGRAILHNIPSMLMHVVCMPVYRFIGHVRGLSAFICIEPGVQNLFRYIARAKETTNEYTCWLENIKGKKERGHFLALETEGRIILKQIFDKNIV
jgi:hypothetical protein